MPVTFNKVTNRESFLVFEDGGDEPLGSVSCAAEAETWKVKINGGPTLDGFKSSSKAREWTKGFFAGVEWAAESKQAE